ncbi:acyl-CoA synthetase, partial [Vibrio parahaemolyticus]|nr:acyl-CoA synthetase [Vibrio parahaemolyticus]MBM4801440.1 acyl-CoA synthetase [Vibrio parahaemolyticus]
MNIVVHVHDGVAKHGYEMGTRQAWKCGDKAHEVYRILGVIKGQVVSVI